MPDCAVECLAICPSTATVAVIRRASTVQLLDSFGEQSWAPCSRAADTRHVALASACWSAHGFSLLLSNASTLSNHALPCFERQSVLRASLPQSATGLPGCSLLLGADRVLLSKRCNAGLSRSWRPEVAYANGRAQTVQRSTASHPPEQLGDSGDRPAALPADSLTPGELDAADGEDESAAELAADPLLHSDFDALLAGWDVVQLPAAYCAHSSPVRCVAVSDSGEHVAVAGSRGLCVWSRRTRKWRQMASQREEWALRPQHIAWLADLAVVVHSRARQQQSRQQWLDSVQRKRQYHAVQRADTGTAPNQWTLAPSPVYAHTFDSSSPLVSDVLVFPRSHLSFASALCLLSFPAACRVCDVSLTGDSLLVRTSAPASLLFRLTLRVELQPASRAPSRAAASASATPTLSSPATPTSATKPLSKQAPLLSTPPAPSSPLSPPLPAPPAPEQPPIARLSNLPSSSPQPPLPSLGSPLSQRAISLLPPSRRAASTSAVLGGSVSSVRCVLREVLPLPVRLQAAGLHRSARQLLLLPSTTLTSRRGLLALLSDTGELHCVALPHTALAAGSGSWLAASGVTAVWTAPQLAASEARDGPTAIQHATPPALLASGLHGLQLVHLQPHTAPPVAAMHSPLPLASACCPLSFDWRSGCVLILRSHRSTAQADASHSSAPAGVTVQQSLSLQPVPFIHRLLSACLSPPQPPPNRSPLWPTALTLLRLASADSALLAMELFVHSELVDEQSALHALPAALRSQRIAAVHSLLAAVASSCLPPLCCAYERVLAHVARKTDSSLWSRLFQLSAQQQTTANETERGSLHFHLDSPMQLAERCVEQGQLHTATLYLLLVQRTDSPRAAHRLAVRILLRMERERRWLKASAGSSPQPAVHGVAELDQRQAEVELDRQVRRFARQTAAIVKEQQQQQLQAELARRQGDKHNGRPPPSAQATINADGGQVNPGSAFSASKLGASDPVNSSETATAHCGGLNFVSIRAEPSADLAISSIQSLPAEQPKQSDAAETAGSSCTSQ